MSIQSNFPNLQPSLLLDFANTKQLDNRVTFTRSTPAVYYDGKTTAMAEQNLFLYSQEFENGYWSKVNSSVTANAGVAPDGTSTADKLIPSASNSGKGLYVHSGNTSANCTVSIFVKAVEYGFATVSFLPSTGGGFRYAVTINLSTGAVTQEDGLISGYSNAVTSIGSGWYRFSITSVNTSANQTILVSGCPTGTPTISAGVPEFTGDGTSGILIWGAQLEQRPVLTAYTVTTSQPITNYIPVLLSAGGNQPRFDCNPTTGESLGLLIEEQRTNLLTYSSDLSNAAWTKTNATVTSNTIVAPDGTLTGDKIIADSTSASHFVYQTPTSAGSRAFSCYLKKGEYSFVALTLYTFADTAKFNLDTGVVVSVSGNMTSATIQSVGNGWYRCTCISSNTPVSYQWIISPLVDSTNVTYIGNGFNGIYAWGAQLEAGAFATSYIATTSASATRTADAASMTGTNFSSWYNADEGSWYSEAATSSTTGNGRIFSVSSLAGASDPIYSINFESNGQTRIYQVVSGSATYDFRPSNYSANTFVKLSGGYKLADYAGVANNSTISTSTSQVRLPMLTYLQIGALTNGSSFFLNGTIKKIAYYPIKVTNAQLQALTS